MINQPASSHSRMPRPQTYLARQDRQHYISCTNDGAQIRLAWEHAQVRMAPSQLLAIADFYQSAVPRLKTNALLGNALYCIIQDEQDNFEVWLLGVGLYLTAREFKRFTHLIIDGADAVRSVAEMAALDEDVDFGRLN